MPDVLKRRRTMANPKSLAAMAPLAFLVLIAHVQRGMADEIDNRLLGAWAHSTSDCEQTFENRDGKVTYREPIDAFSTAFIFGPSEIRGSTGSCQVGRVSSANGYISISLQCNNTVSYLPLTARIKILSSTQMTYGDAADDPLLDATFEKCAF
jgi:hypothetical protein